MKVAIVGRLEDYEEDYLFNKRYTIDYPFREMFDVLNILIIPVLSRLNIEEIESMCDALILPENWHIKLKISKLSKNKLFS